MFVFTQESDAWEKAHLSACFCGVKMVKFLDYWPTLNPQNCMKYCLDLFQKIFMDTLDTPWHTQEMSKNLEL